MLRSTGPKQLKYEFVCIERLVPKDHLLRKITKFIDFRFIHDKVKDLYCPDNGRPALDPTVLFKMLFLGYLFGIRSERRLIEEIKVNVAYRWFLGFSLEDKIPDASTISQNRRRRFNQSTVYQEIFDEIVVQAIRRKMIDGRTLYTDSTHLKANANKNKFVEAEVAKSTRDYIDELERDVAQDRTDHGKKALKEKDPEPETKTVKQSTTDPESGYMHRDGKPKGFFFLDHRSVDGLHGLITDTYVTPGNVHDSIPYLDRLDRQLERFGFEVESVGLDAGYATTGICKGLEDREIFGVVGYRRFGKNTGQFRRKDFFYDDSVDCYVCPANCLLSYRTTNRTGYREYASDPKICKACQFLKKCTTSKTCRRVIARHVWEDSRERIDSNRLTERGKAIYARRKETVERSFADCKELHGHRYARMRGMSKVLEQCLLCAAAFNMKKIALHMSRQGNRRPASPAAAMVWSALSFICRIFQAQRRQYASI